MSTIIFQNKLRLVRLNQALDHLNETLKNNEVADSIKYFGLVNTVGIQMVKKRLDAKWSGIQMPFNYH